MSEIQDTAVLRMSRRAIREAIFKLLYMSEFNSEDEMKNQMDIYFEGAGSDAKQILKDQEPCKEDVDTINQKYDHIKEKLSDLDKIIEETSKGWKLSRMGKVELSIIRLGVYESLFDDTIPVNVAINEAVELAKKFGGEDSGSFVNGILAKIVKEKRA